MQVSSVIEMLQKYYDPNEQILFDLYIKADLDDHFNDEPNLTDSEWLTVIKWGKSLAWHDDVIELGMNIMSNRKRQVRSA